MIQSGPFSGLPRKGFGVIYADPPWSFDTYSAEGKEKSPERHYDTMGIDDICALPVADLAAKDCALFLWCTWPTIFKAQDVIRSWGFKYSGLAWEWLKFNPLTGKAAFGPGYGTRKNLEPCLLARRGSPKLKNRSVRDWLVGDEWMEHCDDLLLSPRREHSRKPDDARTRIESMYDGPYIELFARQSSPGWAVWGNQTKKFDDINLDEAFT